MNKHHHNNNSIITAYQDMLLCGPSLRPPQGPEARHPKIIWSASHLAHQHQCGRDGALSTVLQLDDSGLVARDGCIRRKRNPRKLAVLVCSECCSSDSRAAAPDGSTYHGHIGLQRPGRGIPSPGPSRHSLSPPRARAAHNTDL